MIADGKVANFVSIATGSRLCARAKTAFTSGEAVVERVQLYYKQLMSEKMSRIQRGNLTANSDRLSQMISCDTSGIVNEPCTSVPSLALPAHFNDTLQSKMVISLCRLWMSWMSVHPFSPSEIQSEIVIIVE